MARKKKGKKKRRRSQRGAHYTPRSDLLRSPLYPKIYQRRAIKRQKLQEDLRVWRPRIDRDARRLDGKKVSYTLRDPKRKPYLSAGINARIGFKDPIKVETCIKRKRRRETLFKLRKIGKGKGVSKKRTFNRFSNVRC